MHDIRAPARFETVGKMALVMNIVILLYNMKVERQCYGKFVDEYKILKGGVLLSRTPTMWEGLVIKCCSDLRASAITRFDICTRGFQDVYGATQPNKAPVCGVPLKPARKRIVSKLKAQIRVLHSERYQWAQKICPSSESFGSVLHSTSISSTVLSIINEVLFNSCNMFYLLSTLSKTATTNHFTLSFLLAFSCNWE